MIKETPLFGKVDVQVMDAASQWQSVTPETTGLYIRRGGVRDGLSVKTDVGLCSFTLHNAQDPMNGGTLKPGQAVRVMSGDTSPEPIFTGRIAHLNSVYPINKGTGESRSSVQVTVADAVQIHATTPRYGVTLPSPYYETFEARISRLEVSSNAPVEVPAIGAPREVYNF